jgi:hypothetical protein
MRSFATELNILTLEVLNIFQKMIMLGFYSNEAELIKVINPVISLLDGSNDFTSKEDEELHNKNMIENKGVVDDCYKRDKL